MQLILIIFLTFLYQHNCHQILQNLQVNRNLYNTEQCEINQFLNNDLCQDCHYSCWKCSSSDANNCLECLSDSKRILENQVCKCQGNNYYDENNELFCCRFPCLNCQGKQNNDCLSCQNQMILFENECKCGEHQFFNYVNFLCEDCHFTCSECNGSQNSNCLKCKEDQNTIVQSNICICKDGYYRSSVDNYCHQCHQNCKTCLGPANNECSSCNNNKIGSSCNCPIGYYVSQLIPNSQTCFKCHPTCGTCLDQGEFSCLTCHSNATLQTSSSMCLCDSGYVWNGDSCIQCDIGCGGLCKYDASNCCTVPCVYCFNPKCSSCDATQACTSCQNGKTGRNCDQSCNPICETCDVANPNLCTSCYSPLTLSSGTCNCPSGQAFSGTSCVNASCPSTCTSSGCIDGYYGANCAFPCHPSCKRCWGGNDNQCSLCQNNAFVGSTMCQCFQGHYMDATYNCFKCDYTCRECSGSSTHCTNCDFTYRVLNASNQCECQSGYYDFGIPICQSTSSICGLFCGSCNLISGVYTCQACALIGTYRIDDLANFCPCQNGYFDNGTQICQQCDYKCVKCNNAISCTQCKSNRDLSNNCNCDNGYEEQTQVCVLSATSNVIGIDYNAIIMKEYQIQNCNLINFANKISCQCLDGYYLQNSKCLPCHRKCQTCTLVSTNCTQCSLNHINPPLCSCVNGFQLIDNVCISCNQNCLLCSNNVCTICVQPLILDNYNTCQCTNGQYLDYTTNQCQNCQIQCNQCKYQADYCTKCNFNRILPFQCICPEGTYELSLSQPCQNCSKKCFTCQTNASTCITCSTLRINAPICNCQDNYYEDSHLNCLQCHKKCKTCELSPKNCLECSQNRSSNQCYCNDGYYENDNEICVLCHIKCKTCNGPNEYNCLTCDSTKLFVQSGSTCICKKGYYYENNLCNPCNNDILECQTNYCGDGIKQSYEQCDDYNNINRDGCNSQCQIEEGYQCTLIQNLKLSTLIYYSQCFQCKDINCKFCTDSQICSQCQSGYFLQNNRCNLCDFHCKECLGPSKQQCLSCQLEIFQKENCLLCEDIQGLYLEQNKCISKCGDNIIRLTEQCDDGNIVDGDGCSSTCKLEENWICNSNNNTSSKCQIANIPIASIRFEIPNSIYQSNRYGTIKFNKLMQIDLIQVQQHWIQVIKDMNQMNYNIELVYDTNYDQDYSQINLDIKLYESFQGIIYQLNFTEYLPFDLEGQQLQNQFLEYQLGDYYKVSELQIITAATSKKINIILLATLGGSAFLGLILQSLDFYWNTLDMLQLFSYLSYINVKFPYLHLEFLSIFKFAQMDFLNDLIPIQLTSITESDNYHNYPLLIERDVKENLLINLSSIFVTYTLPFIIYILCKIIIKLNNKYLFDKILISDSKSLGPCQFKFYAYQITYYINQTARIYEQSFLFQILLRVHLSSLFDLNFATFTTVYCWTQHKQTNLNDTLQYLFANLIILIQITIIILLSDSIMVRKYQFKSLQYKLKYGSLFDGFSIFSIQNRQAALLQPFKKILFMASLLVFFNNPLYQIGLLISLHMISAIISIVLQPNINNLETTKAITQDFGILISLNFILIYYIQDNFRYFSQDTIELISYIHIGVYLIMLIIQVIIDCYMQIKLLQEKYPKLKQCSTRKEIKTITSDNTNYYQKQQFIVIQPIQKPIKFNI